MSISLRSSVVRLAAPAALVLAGTTPALAYHLDRTVELSPTATFSLRSEASGIDVRGVEGTKARVVIDSSRSDFESKFDVRFESTGPERLEVVIERKGRGPLGWFSWNGPATTVTVELPRVASAELKSSGGGIEVERMIGDLVAGSSGGGVDVLGIEGNVKVSSSGGSVEVSNVSGGARLDSSGGGIAARAVAGDVEASSSGGGVRLEAIGGAVDAESSGGPVRVAFATGNAKGGRLSSSGGGVTAKVDPAVGLEIDASSSGGSVDCDLPVTVRGKIRRDSLRGQLNGGGATLTLRSSGGGGVSIDPL